MSFERAMDPRFDPERRMYEQLELPFPPPAPSEGGPLVEFLLPENPDEFPVMNCLDVEKFNALLDRVYKDGGSCDVCFIPLERAREEGLIGPLEYQWRRLLRWFRSLGTSKLSASSGARSAPLTPGTEPTAR